MRRYFTAVQDRDFVTADHYLEPLLDRVPALRFGRPNRSSSALQHGRPSLSRCPSSLLPPRDSTVLNRLDDDTKTLPAKHLGGRMDSSFRDVHSILWSHEKPQNRPSDENCRETNGEENYDARTKTESTIRYVNAV